MPNDMTPTTQQQALEALTYMDASLFDMRRAKEVLRAYIEQAEPAGFVRAPVEPTPEMSAAGRRVAKMDVTGAWVTDADDAYRAMIAAAPKEPTK